MAAQARLITFFCLALLLESNPSFAQVAWVKKYDDALKQASAEAKFIVVDISASWCPPCQKMAREVYPDAEFIEFSRNHIFMLLDPDTDPEGIRVASKFEVDSYPTILVLDGKGREIDRLVGGRDTKGLIQDLKEVFANPTPYSELVKKAASQIDDFQLQYSVGKRALERKDYSKARQLLARAAALSETGKPEDRAVAWLYLSSACFKDGKYQEALKALDTLDKMDSRLANSMDGLKMQRARILMALKRYDEGGAIIRDLLRSSRSRAEVEDAKRLLTEMPGKYRKGDKEYAGTVEKAKEHLKKGRIDLALELSQKAAESAPQAAEVHLLLAAGHLEKSNTESDPARKNRHLALGLHEMRLARRLDPEDILSYSDARRYLAFAYLPTQPNSAGARKTYKEAEQRFAEEQYKDAAQLYLKVVQAEPDFGIAYRHIGDCFFASGKMEDALRWYRQSAAKSPMDAAAYRFAAHALTKLGRKEEAGQYIVRSLLADPEYPLVWQNLEEAARTEGRSFERHTDIIPFQFLLLSMDADSYDEKIFDNVPQEAVPAWREYVKNKLLWRQQKFQDQFPKEPFYHTSFQEETDCLQKLVGAWSSLKERNPALRDDNLDFLRQVSIDGKLEAFVFLELYTEEYRSSYEAWKQKKMDTALAYISSYLLNAPQARSRGQYNSSAIEAYNAGVAFHNAGDKTKALESYEKAIAQEPEMVPALTNASLIRFESGDLDGARIALQKWAKADPLAAKPLALLAGLECQDGNCDSAIDLLEKAIALEKDPSEQSRYQALLSSLRLQSPRPAAQPAMPRNADQKAVILVPAREAETDLAPATAATDGARASENDPIARLEKRLLSASDEAEKDWLHLMLGIAHYQAQHWKEAKQFLAKVLEKDPDNFSAGEMMKAIEKMQKP